METVLGLYDLLLLGCGQLHEVGRVDGSTHSVRQLLLRVEWVDLLAWSPTWQLLVLANGILPKLVLEWVSCSGKVLL